MNKTAKLLIENAQYLIQTRGYNAFSYSDLAKEMGIRKASIHYHFPTKSDLGVAVVQAYAEQIQVLMPDVTDPDPESYISALSNYLTPIMAMAADEEIICLCGSLAAEQQTLSPDMQAEVTRFFKTHIIWLGTLLARGREAGAFRFEGDPDDLAKLAFSALQGGMLVRRALSDPSVIYAAARQLRQSIGLAD